jgi:hypothetical protein
MLCNPETRLKKEESGHELSAKLFEPWLLKSRLLSRFHIVDIERGKLAVGDATVTVISPLLSVRKKRKRSVLQSSRVLLGSEASRGREYSVDLARRESQDATAQ